MPLELRRIMRRREHVRPVVWNGRCVYGRSVPDVFRHRRRKQCLAQKRQRPVRNKSSDSPSLAVNVFVRIVLCRRPDTTARTAMPAVMRLIR